VNTHFYTVMWTFHDWWLVKVDLPTPSVPWSLSFKANTIIEWVLLLLCLVIPYFQCLSGYFMFLLLIFSSSWNQRGFVYWKWICLFKVWMFVIVLSIPINHRLTESTVIEWTMGLKLNTDKNNHELKHHRSSVKARHIFSHSKWLHVLHWKFHHWVDTGFNYRYNTVTCPMYSILLCLLWDPTSHKCHYSENVIVNAEYKKSLKLFRNITCVCVCVCMCIYIYIYTGWPRSHRTPRKYAPQTQYKFTMHSAARSTV